MIKVIYMFSKEIIYHVKDADQEEGNNIKNYKALYHNEKNKNKYLMAKINILENNHNKGEKDEVLLLLELFYMNEINQYNYLVEIFGEEASEGILFINIDTDKEIIDINKISKAPSNYKADCRIKMRKTKNIYNISIKSKNGAIPSILNHTPRSAKIFQENGIFNNYLPYIDKIIEEYIMKRQNKIIGEDVLISNLMCFKNNILLKEKFKEVLSYFVFDGTGKGYSKCKSNAIITYENKKIIFKKYDTIEDKKVYIDSIYDKIVISLRDKNMPKIIPIHCKPWIFNDIKPDGSIKSKGSLHVRIK